MAEHIMIAGEAGIDFLPDSTGPLENVERFSRKVGGSAVNAAIGLSNLGIPPLLATRVGADPFGNAVLSVIEEHDIPLDYVGADPDAMTSLAFVRYTDDSNLDFTFFRHETADTKLQPGTVSAEILESLSWVHVTGVLLASEPSRSTLLSLMEEAQQAGCRVSFNPNTRPQLWADRKNLERDLHDALELADVVIATPEDFEPIGYDVDDPPELARALCRRGPKSVFLAVDTISAYGLVMEGPFEGTAWNEGYDVDPVYPIGATDAFTAGIIASMTNDATSLQEVVESANAVATISTMSPGAITAFSLNRSVQSLYPDPPWPTDQQF